MFVCQGLSELFPCFQLSLCGLAFGLVWKYIYRVTHLYVGLEYIVSREREIILEFIFG